MLDHGHAPTSRPHLAQPFQQRLAAWTFLVLACIGAASCLFAGLMLSVRLLTVVGILSPPPGSPEAPVRPAGGRRAAR